MYSLLEVCFVLARLYSYPNSCTGTLWDFKTQPTRKVRSFFSRQPLFPTDTITLFILLRPVFLNENSSETSCAVHSNSIMSMMPYFVRSIWDDQPWASFQHPYRIFDQYFNNLLTEDIYPFRPRVWPDLCPPSLVTQCPPQTTGISEVKIWNHRVVP